MNIRIAHFGMGVDQIVENIMVGMQRCASLIGKKWNGIQAIHLKTNESVALPIYYSPMSFTKLPAIRSSQSDACVGKVTKGEEIEETVAPINSNKALASTTKPGKKHMATSNNVIRF